MVKHVLTPSHSEIASHTLAMGGGAGAASN